MSDARERPVPSVLILNDADVEACMPMKDAVAWMVEALRTLAGGDAVQPLRSLMWLPDRTGLLGLMPGYLGDPSALGIKVVTVMPGNQSTPYDSHQGSVLLFEPRYGQLIAVLDATSITSIRTAAVSAAATDALARTDAGDLAILGSGAQAHAHLEAMRVARPLRRIRVWSRDPAKARRFAERERERFRDGLPIEVFDQAEDAVRGADVICTTTSAREPILEGRWIARGAHLNAVGACFAAWRELDTESVRRSRIFVDRMESAMNEAGDLLIPIREGAIQADAIAGELGDVFAGRLPGRRSPDEITLFKSLGIAVEDLASARRIYERALELGRGVSVPWGGARHAGA
jgi:ornithine cyclodeaminase/alanine dehydrogenase-like protein (mu-crystallin family)